MDPKRTRNWDQKLEPRRAGVRPMLSVTVLSAFNVGTAKKRTIPGTHSRSLQVKLGCASAFLGTARL